jgi:hypothetical protein
MPLVALPKVTSPQKTGTPRARIIVRGLIRTKQSNVPNIHLRRFIRLIVPNTNTDHQVMQASADVI